MRILQINSARNFGGGERHFVDICQGLKQRGHEVFALIHPESMWSDRLSFLNKNVIKLNMRNSLDFLSAFKIAQICRDNKIEILHTHLAKDYLPASLACRLLPKTSLFLTRHVMFPLSAFYRKALNNVTKAIAVSNAVSAELERIFPSEKIVIIPNGIKVENWMNHRKNRDEFLSFHNIPKNTLIVGTLGELKELKGQTEFIIAAKLVVTEFPNTYFVIVGQDNSLTKRYRLELKRLAKVLGLKDRVLFLDWVEDTSIFFSAIDVFVSPSRSESFGLAILEAMASGVAIVATKTQGATELLEDKISAKLVPIKDSVKMADAIKLLLKDKNLRRRYAINAQERASKFSFEKMIGKLEEVYLSSVKKP